MNCTRCPLHCTDKPACKVVRISGQGVSDAYPWMPVYMSLLPAEEVPLYHTCPGGLTLRIVLPGAPWRCSTCFWREYLEPESLVLRRLEPSEFSRLRSIKPEVVMVDGGEPLLQDWPYQLPAVISEAVGGTAVFAFRTTGVIAVERLERARRAGYRVAVFEYTLAVEPPPKPDHALEVLRAAYSLFDVLEVHFLYPGGRKAEIMLSDLASSYPDAAIHVIPVAEEASDRAYDAVEKLRDKGLPNVYLYRDESYTLTDTVCECGQTLVSRKPWGVKVQGSVERDGRLRCPKCGRVHRLIACQTPVPRRAIHREVAIW